MKIKAKNGKIINPFIKLVGKGVSIDFGHFLMFSDTTFGVVKKASGNIVYLKNVEYDNPNKTERIDLLKIEEYSVLNKEDTKKLTGGNL